VLRRIILTGAVVDVVVGMLDEVCDNVEIEGVVVVVEDVCGVDVVDGVVVEDVCGSDVVDGVVEVVLLFARLSK